MEPSRCLCLVLALTSVASAQPGDTVGRAPAARQRIDLSHIPRDAVLAFVVRPNEIAHCKGMRPLIAALDRMFGLKTYTAGGLLEFRAAFTDFGVGKQQPSGYAIFRSKTTMDWASFARDLFGGEGKPKDHAGHVLYVVNPRAAYYLPDERTLVSAGESQIEGVVDRFNQPQESHAWADRWQKVADGQIALMVDTAAFDSQLNEVLRDAPPERQALLAPVKPLWHESRQLFLGLKADEDLRANGEFYCNSADSAAKVCSSLGASLILGRNILDNSREDDVKPRNDEVEIERMLLDLAAQLISNSTAISDDKILHWRSNAKPSVVSDD